MWLWTIWAADEDGEIFLHSAMDEEVKENDPGAWEQSLTRLERVYPDRVRVLKVRIPREAVAKLFNEVDEVDAEDTQPGR